MIMLMTLMMMTMMMMTMMTIDDDDVILFVPLQIGLGEDNLVGKFKGKSVDGKSLLFDNGGEATIARTHTAHTTRARAHT